MPATTINQIIVRLEDIYTDSVRTKSRMGYFTALYLRVTKAVRDKINEGNYFEDNARMEQLDVVFANRYIDAYEAYHKGEACSECWKVAFDATKKWNPIVLQHLFVGMNAHISLDLGIAAATVSPGSEINALHNDFNKINELLNGLVGTVQNELAQIWRPMKWIDKLMGKTDEAIAQFAMGIARDAAWEVALEYAPLTTAEEKEEFIAKRDKEVAGFGRKLIYLKSWLLRIPLFIIRMMEKGTIRKKLSILNQGN
jgi:hypothetical protein